MTVDSYTDPVTHQVTKYDGVKTGEGVLFEGDIGDANMKPIERQKWGGHGHVQELWGEMPKTECAVVPKPRKRTDARDASKQIEFLVLIYVCR